MSVIGSTEPPVVHVPESTGDVTFEWPGMVLHSRFSPPRSRPAASGREWAHAARAVNRLELAGHHGRLIRDTFRTPGLELVRECWVDSTAPAVACRLLLRNCSENELFLDALYPLHCSGPGSLLIAGQDAGGWVVVPQGRLKNHVPTSVRLGRFDADYGHAVLGLRELGDNADALAEKHYEVEADSFCVIRPETRPDDDCLLIGFLSQYDHLARIRIKTDHDRRCLDQLLAECELDGCLVPPGEVRHGQWAFVAAGADPNLLVADFTDRVRRHHGLSAPGRQAPAVFCSWQYYGPHFTERDLAEDLAALARDPIPFDVYLIDECWSTAWGDWRPNAKWPSGMKAAADLIRSHGYRPGIWSCPFLVMQESDLAGAYPEWLLKLPDGFPHRFPMMGGQHHVLDPTAPGVEEFLENLFRRMTNEWGYTYHKLDFLRGVLVDGRVAFHDPQATRLEAYRRGIEAVRRGIGPDSYLSICGGHYGGSMGIADSQRSGSDVAGAWSGRRPALPKIKQNIYRTWMGGLWHVDPDAMMVRRRDKVRSDDDYGFLSLGTFTDEEARTIALNQYLGGGLVCLSEKPGELDADRRALYRHVIPSVNSPSVPVDYFAPRCPSILLTRVEPVCSALGRWNTVAVINWDDQPRARSFALTPEIRTGMEGDSFALYEFFDDRFLGLFGAGNTVELGEIPAHGSRLVRMAPWNGREPMLLGTDLHFSGGGVEVAAWEAVDGGICGTIKTPWHVPVKVTVAFPAGDGVHVVSTTVGTEESDFHLRPDRISFEGDR